MNSVETSPKIQIFVLCYNRPQLAMETLQSLAAQTYKNIEIIVSDNSSYLPLNEETVLSLGRTIYRRRVPSLPPELHFNTIMTEATAEFFMMVHDDDLYDPSCVAKLVEGLKQHPSAVAAVPNARMMWGTDISKSLINPSFHHNVVFSAPRDFLRRYFRPDLGINPFPGYLYRTGLIGQQRLDSREAGKYSDATFLTRLLANGSILWLGEPLMSYRRHAQNDSGKLEWRQAHQLVLWAIQHAGFKKADLDLQIFRHWIHLLNCRDQIRAGGRLSRREKMAVVFFFARHPLVSAKILLQKFKHRVVWFG